MKKKDNKIPSYGLPGKKSTYCSPHAPHGYVKVRKKKKKRIISSVITNLYIG